ncbi:hypothetical protein CNY67_11775 [Desulfovibrio sp. G11]|nr:hypothetical protein CNY67_11775 [Desulfovibrio sp. G11]
MQMCVMFVALLRKTRLRAGSYPPGKTDEAPQAQANLKFATVPGGLAFSASDRSGFFRKGRRSAIPKGIGRRPQPQGE